MRDAFKDGFNSITNYDIVRDAFEDGVKNIDSEDVVKDNYIITTDNGGGDNDNKDRMSDDNEGNKESLLFDVEWLSDDDENDLQEVRQQVNFI